MTYSVLATRETLEKLAESKLCTLVDREFSLLLYLSQWVVPSLKIRGNLKIIRTAILRSCADFTQIYIYIAASCFAGF